MITNTNINTDIQAYQALLKIFTSPSVTSIDYKAVVLRIAQNHPSIVVEAIEYKDSTLNLNDPLVLTCDEEKMIRAQTNKIIAIRELRTMRNNSGRESVSGLKDCKDAVESLGIKWPPYKFPDAPLTHPMT